MTVFKKPLISLLLVAVFCVIWPSMLLAAECGDGIFSSACGTFKSLETLEITAPDRFLYAIIDGGTGVQQFGQIKANIRSLYGGQSLSGGELRAVATYRRRTNYQPDLSTDPPTADDREDVVAKSHSHAIPVESVSADEKTEFTFYFNLVPIPAGITDLRFAVFYEGTTSNNTPVFAYGTKDLNEPHHLLLINSSDRVYLDHVLKTAAEVRGNNLFWPNDSTLDPYTDLKINLKVYLDWNDDYIDALTNEITYAEYSRVIFLTDESEFNIFAQFLSPTRYNNPDSHWIRSTGLLCSGVVNQEDNDSFENTQIETFRGKRAHTVIEFVNSYPDDNGVKTANWPYDLYEPTKPVTVWP
jgi:hypothetical protein